MEIVFTLPGWQCSHFRRWDAGKLLSFQGNSCFQLSWEQLYVCYIYIYMIYIRCRYIYIYDSYDIWYIYITYHIMCVYTYTLICINMYIYIYDSARNDRLSIWPSAQEAVNIILQVIFQLPYMRSFDLRRRRPKLSWWLRSVQATAMEWELNGSWMGTEWKLNWKLNVNWMWIECEFNGNWMWIEWEFNVNLIGIKWEFNVTSWESTRNLMGA